MLGIINIDLRAEDSPTATNQLVATLLPRNGEVLEVVINQDNDPPVPGLTISARATPVELTDPQWRDIQELASRWPTAAGRRLVQRHNDGHIRLGATFRSDREVTDARGQARFYVNAWHVCGGGLTPAVDKLTFAHDGRDIAEALLGCGVAGLVPITNDSSQGVVTKSGIVGAYVGSTTDQALREAGQIWKTESTHPIVVTDGSLRWGGLLPPHMTHRYGSAVDLRPASTDGKPTRIGQANYSKEGTRALIDILTKTNATSVIFGEQLPGVTKVSADHNRHIHVSWLSDPSEPW